MPYKGEANSNPKFAYPKNRDSIRFLDAQRALDISKSGDKPVAYSKRGFQIQRGYMRNLPPATLRAVPVSKCYFQFNPQEIRQNVQMREDIYNPILLTAEQLSQPIGGNVSFQFDLFFDRSHELASNNKGPLSSSINESLSSNSPYYTSKNEKESPIPKGPELVGVYADLRVLYNIIGQGLSDNTIQLQLDMLRSTYNAKVAREAAYSESTAGNAATTGTNTTADTTTTTADTLDPFSRDFTDLKKVEDLLSSNLGNAAFLLPNPVRIVFSPLLMVDGFVTNTSVDFLKFNNDMIPMQCRVAIGVNALYIGFAKSDTFLTTTIETGRQALVEENLRDTAAMAPIEKAIKTLSTFRMGFGTIPLQNGQAAVGAPTWGEAIWQGDIPYPATSWYLIPDAVAGEYIYKRIGFAGFPAIRTSTEDKTDPILKLFGDPNVNFTIGYSWNFRIYGRANQNDYNGVGWTSSQALSVFRAGTYNDSSVAAKMGDYSSSVSASSKEEWGYGESGKGASPDCIRKKTYLGTDALPNLGEYSLLFDTETRRTNINSSYYIIKYDFKITATTGSITREYTFDNPRNYVVIAAGSQPLGVLDGQPSKLTTINKFVSYVTT